MVNNLIIARLVELIRAPLDHSDLLWITLPLIITLILMELYFGRYRDEELGWNTAVGNSLILVFVSMDLFRFLWNSTPEPTIIKVIWLNFTKSLLIFFLGLGSLWLLIADFFHFIPKKVAFFLSSSLTIKLIAYITIVIVYTDIPIDLATFFASIMLFLLLLGIFRVIQFFEPIYVRER